MKMVVAWHDAAFHTAELTLTPEILDRILEKFKLQHQLKDNWNPNRTKAESDMYEKMVDSMDTTKGASTAD